VKKIIYREIPKPPGPSGVLSERIWFDLCDRNDLDYSEYQEIELEMADIGWLLGYRAGVSDVGIKSQVWDLIMAIKKLGQVQIVWITE